VLIEFQDFNEVIKQWAPEGVTVEKKDVLSHHEVMTRAEVYDGERGVKLVGHRGFFLRKWGVLLNQALINYGLHFLTSKGYDPIQPPYFMKAEYMAKTAQLEQFDEELYKVVEDKDAEDKYLIATSEQPLSAMFADEWMAEKDLPMKFAGYSTCFRKEAGSHGKDAWGLYRIHQFEKVSATLSGFVARLMCLDRAVPLHETRRLLAGTRGHEERRRGILSVTQTPLPSRGDRLGRPQQRSSKEVRPRSLVPIPR
jgi:seryl-tRNA synthetase